MASEYIISIDLGGTKILSALLDEKNQIVDRLKIRTDMSQGNAALVKTIADGVDSILANNNLKYENIKAISMGVPGTVNPETGIIGSAPNLSIRNYNIKEALLEHIPIPFFIENDVNLGGLGIKKFEFNDDVNNMLVVFVGTGIGSAIFIDGKIYRGSLFFAGEIGHMVVSGKGKLSKGKNKRSFEQVASRSAIVKNIRMDLKAKKKSAITEFAPKGENIKSGALAQALAVKDKVVTKHIDNACRTIGSVLGSITTLMNFDTIVLGGGVIEAMGDYILPKIKTAFDSYVLEEPGKYVIIKSTKLGDDAPLYGGAALAEELLG